jgi:hypothetical protein
MLEHTTDANLTTTDKEPTCRRDVMHIMADMVQCNLSNLSRVGIPDKQLGLKLHFLPSNLSGCLSWNNIAGVSYFNIKWSGENQVGVPKYSGGSLRVKHTRSTRHDMMRDANWDTDGIFMFNAFF